MYSKLSLGKLWKHKLVVPRSNIEHCVSKMLPERSKLPTDIQTSYNNNDGNAGDSIHTRNR